MFEDKRSKKVLLVAHCILNQNAKIDRCAHFAGAVPEVVVRMIESGVGIIQMPCPELMFLGLDRQVDVDAPGTVETEDTRVGWLMAGEQGQAFCRHIVNDLLFQIEEYQKNGFEVVGLVGINGSPTCGVEISWFDDQESTEPGVFIRLLREALAAKNLDLPMRGIKVYEPDQALTAVKELLGELL